MTDLPPERKNGEPHDPSEPRRPEIGPRAPRRGRAPHRHRASKPPRLHDGNADPASLPPINWVELPARQPTVPFRRRFRVADTEWLAWVSGFGAYGTGNAGLGTVQAVHFALAQDPDTPLREALMPTGRFEDLFDEELLRLYAESREIRLPEPGAAPQRVRRRGEGLS